LRGVNVGGHKKIAMAALKSAFESMGFRNVKTILASGNVVFEVPDRDPHLGQTVGRGLEKAFGFPVKVVLRTVRELRILVASDPFKGAPSGPDIKFYVTFFATRTPGRSRLRVPASAKGVRIIRVTPGEIFSTVTLSPGVGTPDLMAHLDKALGDASTTRNWNTIIKITG